MCACISMNIQVDDAAVSSLRKNVEVNRHPTHLDSGGSIRDLAQHQTAPSSSHADEDPCGEGMVNVYSSAADPLRYRQPDQILSACSAHGRAAVLCYTAGKTGRAGRTAAIGATPFWLTCSHLNNLVARLERQGAVAAVARLMRSNTEFAQAHADSHAVYAQRVKQLLSHEQWLFFDSHFVNPADACHRKFGNAAVSHVHDLKCLHALVAQSLCGAPNPIGDIVINFIAFMHTLLPSDTVEETGGGGYAACCGSCHDAGCDGEDCAGASGRTPIDSVELFDNFIHAAADAKLRGDKAWRICVQDAHHSNLDQSSNPILSEESLRHACTSDGDDARAASSFRVDVPSLIVTKGAFPTHVAPPSTSPCASQLTRTHVWQSVGAFEQCKPDLCQQAYYILVHLLGKAPRSHRKRRIN